MSRPAAAFALLRRDLIHAAVLGVAFVALMLVLFSPMLLPAGAQTDPPALPTGSFTFEKRVYAGYDGGASCGSAHNFAVAGQTDPVTYCFTVTNTGEAALGGIVVIDAFVDGEPLALAADSNPLASGDTAYFYLETTPPADDADGFVDDTYINKASATAYAVDEVGTGIEGIAPIGGSAEAVVYPSEEVEALAPKVSLVTTVYPGADGGAGCPASKSATAVEGSPITHCLTVTNTGNTHLDRIDLGDPALQGDAVMLRADSAPLAPGDSAYYYVESPAPAAASDIATSPFVTANAVDETGADLVGVDDVTGTDTATINSTSDTAAPPRELAATDDGAESIGAAGSASQTQTETTPAVTEGESDAAADGAASAAGQGEAPTALAYTGWESWLIAFIGIGIAALGWLLLDPGRGLRTSTVLRNRPVPVRTAKRSLGELSSRRTR